jgi:signal transduction histidine kinase
LVFLGSSAYHASVGAYVSFFGILLLQGIEVFYPLLSKDGEDTKRHMAILRASILLQLLLASVLVAFTDGSGSIYELVYLLPIISAATKLPGRDVAFVVGSAVVAMIGFIVTGEELTASIARVKAFQDAVAATTYFTMAGILTYLFAKDEREQRQHYQAMAEALARTNAELRLVQTELTERLVQVTQMEERIQRTGQMAALGELAGQVAHEVRNPLGIIKGATEMLAARISDPSIQRHISVLLEEVDRLNHAVEGILRLGTPLRIQTSPLHLQDLLRSVTQSVAAATDGSVVVSLDLPDTPIRINGDRELLHHALTNLVRNGYQAMPSGGCLTVSARVRATGEDLTVLIADTGVGLPAEDLKRLGEPFFTKRPGGVGLGFALARRIIVEHAGTVDVRSAPGLGTTITIQLPVQRFQPAGLAAMETKDRR